MIMIRVFTMYVLIWATTHGQAQPILQHLDQFRRDTQLDGKMCKATDVAFQVPALSLARCSGWCRITVGCPGFMFNPAKSTCVCCRGKYTEETTLVSEEDTQYFAGDWWSFDGNFYKLSTTEWNFTNAVEYCKLNGGFIARIDSAEKAEFIAGSHESATESYWIGLTDVGHEGTWTWINDGSTVNYTNWNVARGQPNGDGDCVRCNGASGYLWGDAKCRAKMQVLCEKQ